MARLTELSETENNNEEPLPKSEWTGRPSVAGAAAAEVRESAPPAKKLLPGILQVLQEGFGVKGRTVNENST